MLVWIEILLKLSINDKKKCFTLMNTVPCTHTIHIRNMRTSSPSLSRCLFAWPCTVFFQFQKLPTKLQNIIMYSHTNFCLGIENNTKSNRYSIETDKQTGTAHTFYYIYEEEKILIKKRIKYFCHGFFPFALL